MPRVYNILHFAFLHRTEALTLGERREASRLYIIEFETHYLNCYSYIVNFI
ncbi:MAG: hypothetical protein VSS75_014225 [Candidatus Parabeggiatoa sp.]|nr:hypothetical protein [Candidatus Parabeggiatoa sp.]